MKYPVPWWAKIAAKVILSRLPVSYRMFERLGLFRHGDMTDPEYALNVFEAHRAHLPDEGALAGLTCLELGPGDSLASALLCRARGAAHTYMVDSGAFAATDPALYAAQADALRRRGLHTEELSGCADLGQMLQVLQATYMTRGLQSLQKLPDNSIDFIWSQAVLEHIRFDEFDATQQQLARILRPGGLISHRVDLQDHLSHSLHNLRFSRSMWERDWLAGSGFYTNRIRFSDMLQRFAAAGFSVQVHDIDRWPQLPLARKCLDEEFAELEDAELCIKGFSVTMTHTPGAADQPG